MDKKSFLSKITSRKFWAALISFITPILIAFNVDKLTQEQIIAIITGVGGLVCYMFAESYVDGKNASSNTTSKTEYYEAPGSIIDKPASEDEEVYLDTGVAPKE